MMNKIAAVLTIIAMLVVGTLAFDAPLISGLMALLVFMINF